MNLVEYSQEMIDDSFWDGVAIETLVMALWKQEHIVNNGSMDLKPLTAAGLYSSCSEILDRLQLIFIQYWTRTRVADGTTKLILWSLNFDTRPNLQMDMVLILGNTVYLINGVKRDDQAREIKKRPLLQRSRTRSY